MDLRFIKINLRLIEVVMDTYCPYVVELYLPRAADMFTRLNPNDLANAIGVWGIFTAQNNIVGHSGNPRIEDCLLSCGLGRKVTVEVSYIVGSHLRELGGGMIGSARFVHLRIRYRIRLVARRHGEN